MKLRAELRVRNNSIIAARQELGFSQKKLAEVSGVSMPHIQNLEKLDYSGGVAQYLAAEKLAGFLDLEIEDIYPEALAGVAFPSSIVRYEERRGLELAEALARHHELPSPSDEEDVVKEAVLRQMEGLEYREREVLKLRFGLSGNGGPYTLEETAKIFRITRDRVRQIEIKALKKLGSRACAHLRRQHGINPKFEQGCVYDLHSPGSKAIQDPRKSP